MSRTDLRYSTIAWRAAIRQQRIVRYWVPVSILEAGCTAYLLVRVVRGALSLSPSPLLWFTTAFFLSLAFLFVSLWAASDLVEQAGERALRSRVLLWGSTLPFLAIDLFGLHQLQYGRNLDEWRWQLLPPIEPFPILAVVIAFLVVSLLKISITALSLPDGRRSGRSVGGGFADIAIPIALLVIGALQSSVFLIPIGNAFLRFWALADSFGLGISYPVTLTEPGPMSAGSPPYVYDLPLFPLMLRLAFTLFGHDSFAAYIPSLIFNTLFPLSLYLLIREATRSRTTAVIFASLASLFPYLRFWVLNLPDPDPVLLTSACFAAFFYLRALDARHRTLPWIVAGLASGVLSLARPEGILYAGCLALGVVAGRPRMRQLALFSLSLGLFVVPMVAVWWANFGFLWPQNYNNTLGLQFAAENYELLRRTDALGIYQRGLGLDIPWAVALLGLFLLSVLAGTIAMIAQDRRLLAFVVPGIGNTALIFFANPWIPNTFHFADFFRHASFGIPFLMVASAYSFQVVYRHLTSRGLSRIAGYALLLFLVATVVREGDILANPTATHRPEGTGATQVLTTYTHLSMQAIREHRLRLPTMTYRWNGEVNVAYPIGIAWPEDALAFFKPLDMAFESSARPFGYASALVALIALAFALITERAKRDTLASKDPTGAP